MADCEHASWARWQRYVNDQCPDRVIPSYLYDGWERQIATSYADLSEREKEYDRKEVRLVLDALRAANLVIIDRNDVIMAKDAAVGISWEDPGSGGWEALADRLKEALGESA